MQSGFQSRTTVSCGCARSLTAVSAFCLISGGILFTENVSFAAELPKQITIRDAAKAAVYQGGKFSKTVDVGAGDSFDVLRFERGYFVVPLGGGEAKIDQFNTELARTNYALLKRMTTPTNATVTATNAAIDPAEFYYSKAKIGLLDGNANKSQYIGEDVQAVEALITAAEAVVKAYESGDKEKTIELGKARQAIKDVVYQKSDIRAYKYNELLKQDVAVPVKFDLYTGGEDFYLKFGDGNFSTIVTVPLNDLVGFVSSLPKVDSWITTCREQKLETRKEIYRIGDTVFTFNSFGGGKMWTVWVKIHGNFREDALVESQEVKLAPLNFWRLGEHMLQARQIALKKLKEMQDSEKLR